MANRINPDTEVIDHIRLNIAFEQSVLSVLTGAAIGGAAIFVVTLVGVILGGGLSIPIFVAIILRAVFVSFLIFLTGFIASAVVVAPMFMALEKRKQRNVWPYLMAAIVLAILVLLLTNNGLGGIADANPEVLVTIIAPAIIIALIFGRRMRPHWRAAEQRETEALTNVVRLH